MTYHLEFDAKEQKHIRKYTKSSFDQFWTKQELLDRGWTKTGIETLLGEPDEYRRNPMSHSKNAYRDPHSSAYAPVCLFSKSRVMRKELWLKNLTERLEKNAK